MPLKPGCFRCLLFLIPSLHQDYHGKAQNNPYSPFPRQNDVPARESSITRIQWSDVLNCRICWNSPHLVFKLSLRHFPRNRCRITPSDRSGTPAGIHIVLPLLTAFPSYPKAQCSVIGCILLSASGSRIPAIKSTVAVKPARHKSHHIVSYNHLFISLHYVQILRTNVYPFINTGKWTGVSALFPAPSCIETA